MNIILNVILSIVGFAILILAVICIMFYTIGFFQGFIEALEDFVNTQKNK
jgi:hypothetical protein